MKRLARSFKHAIRGILFTLKGERNFQIEIAVMAVVLVSAIWFNLTQTENIILVLAVALVLATELINTAVERVMDILKPRVHPYARVIKDVMAGAVFVVSLGALLIGIVIFFPYFFK